MSFMIIDSHMHLGPSASYLSMDMSLEGLLHQMDRLEIERGISAHHLGLMDEYEASVTESIRAFEQTGGRIYAYYCFSPLHPDAGLATIRANYGNPVFRGIKIHPSGCAVDADSERYRPIWELARELKLPIISHTWNISYYHPSQKSAFAGKFEKYVSEYPDVTFTFAHSGGRYDGVLEAVRIGKAHKNCYFDIAGDINGSGVLDYLYDNLGADRILYGSDCYMIEQRPMLGVILGSRLNAAEKEKVLRYNALKVYFSDIG